jgi:WD40 repeat protein
MEEGPVHLYDTNDGTILLTLDEPYLPIAGLEFTADGRYLIGGGCGEGTLSLRRCDNAQAWVWEVATGELAATTQFPVPEAAFNEVAISPDGRLAAAGIIPFDPDPQRIAVWDATSGELLAEKQAKEVGSEAAYGLAFSPDGRFLSSNGPDGFMLWEIAAGEQLVERFVWPDAPDVTIAAFSGDGRYLAAGTNSGAINLWDVESGRAVTRLETVHTEAITDLTFSPNGQLLISAGEDNTVSRIDLGQFLAQTQSTELSTLVEACQRANRDLTDAEWRRYFGDEPYRESCPDNRDQ